MSNEVQFKMTVANLNKKQVEYILNILECKKANGVRAGTSFTRQGVRLYSRDKGKVYVRQSIYNSKKYSLTLFDPKDCILVAGTY